MQAAQGDNEGERPMWAEKGGLDFEGRARWDAWTERKGMKPPRAKMLFVQVPPPLDSHAYAALPSSCWATFSPLWWRPQLGHVCICVYRCDKPCCMLQHKLLATKGFTLKAHDGHKICCDQQRRAHRS
jgi:hypothetical protein